MIIIYKKKAAVRSTGAPFTEPSFSVVSSLRCLRQLLLSTDPLGILDSHLYVLLPGLQGQRLPLPESKLMDLPDAPSDPCAGLLVHLGSLLGSMAAILLVFQTGRLPFNRYLPLVRRLFLFVERLPCDASRGSSCGTCFPPCCRNSPDIVLAQHNTSQLCLPTACLHV